MNKGRLKGLIDWIDADLLRLIDDRRKQDGEMRRNRKLGTTETLWLMLAVALNAGANGLHEIIRSASADFDVGWSVSTAAFCKARKRFSPPQFAFLARSLDPVSVPSARG